MGAVHGGFAQDAALMYLLTHVERLEEEAIREHAAGSQCAGLFRASSTYINLQSAEVLENASSQAPVEADISGTAAYKQVFGRGSNHFCIVTHRDVETRVIQIEDNEMTYNIKWWNTLEPLETHVVFANTAALQLQATLARNIDRSQSSSSSAGAAMGGAMSDNNDTTVEGPWSLGGLDQLAVVNMPRQDPRGVCHLGHSYRPCKIWRPPAIPGLAWLDAVLGALVNEVARALGSARRLLWFRLDYNSESGSTITPKLDEDVGTPSDEDIDAPGSAPPVLLFVPSDLTAGGSSTLAGAFVEVWCMRDETDGEPPLVHAYEIVVVERSAQRRLVFSSHAAHALASLPLREDATTRHAAADGARSAAASRGLVCASGDVFAFVVDSGGHKAVCGSSLTIARTRSHAREKAERNATVSGGSALSGFRDAAEAACAEWAEARTELHVSADALVGLIPDALLSQYVFWRTGRNILRGYALPASIGSQLLVRLHRTPLGGDSSNAKTAKGTVVYTAEDDAECNVKAASGGSAGDSSVAAEAVVANVVRLPCTLSATELARGQWMPERPAADMGELRVGANLRMLSDVKTLKTLFRVHDDPKSARPPAPDWDDSISAKAGQRCVVKNKEHEPNFTVSFEDGVEMELPPGALVSLKPVALPPAPDYGAATLLNPLGFARGSLSAYCARVLARVEPWAQVLFWASGVAAPGDEVALSKVELPRLGVSFELRADGRLWCVEHSGWFVSDASPRACEAPGAHHALVMRNAAGDMQLLLPNVALRRVFATDAPLCAEYRVVPDSVDEKAPYFLLPVDAAERFLKVPFDRAAYMALIWLRAAQRDYAGVVALATRRVACGRWYAFFFIHAYPGWHTCAPLDRRVNHGTLCGRRPRCKHDDACGTHQRPRRTCRAGSGWRDVVLRPNAWNSCCSRFRRTVRTDEWGAVRVLPPLPIWPRPRRRRRRQWRTASRATRLPRHDRAADAGRRRPLQRRTRAPRRRSRSARARTAVR